MTGPRAPTAGAQAAGRAPAGHQIAGHRAAPAPASTPSHTGRAPDLNPRSGARGKPAPGNHTDALAQEADWAAFFRTEWPSVVRQLRVSFGEASTSDAADAAQNAFLDLFRHWGEVNSPRAWVRTVAVRHMMRQSTREQALRLKLSDAVNPALSCPPASGPLEVFDQEQAVLAFLRQLPETQRQVLALVYDGFTIREVAEILGTTETAARKSLQRGRSKLRDMLPSSQAPGTRR
jgi:RNA polymerase sigma factor (sigma-70 family)